MAAELAFDQLQDLGDGLPPGTSAEAFASLAQTPKPMCDPRFIGVCEGLVAKAREAEGSGPGNVARGVPVSNLGEARAAPRRSGKGGRVLESCATSFRTYQS
jgi:hypothetical protein